MVKDTILSLYPSTANLHGLLAWLFRISAEKMAEIGVVAIGASFLVGIATTANSHGLLAWLFRISAETIAEIGVVAREEFE